jgi:hypothetical protein
MNSMPPYIRYGQSVRALDFPSNQKVPSSNLGEGVTFLFEKYIFIPQIRDFLPAKAYKFI